jgi:SAM-dependent methyltransferase
MPNLVWEDRIYSQGKHLNRYPYGELVSLFFNARADLKTAQIGPMSLLELGCGAGNNLWFFAENGLDCVGIDASETACDLSRQRLAERGVGGRILCMNFDQLDALDGSFDFIVDRAATYCADFPTRQRWWKAALARLKPGGIVISVNFDKSSVWYQKAVNEPGFARMVATDTFTDFAYGPLVDTGTSHFVDKSSLLALFDGLETLNILSRQCASVYHAEHPYQYSELIYIGRKEHG